MDNSVTGDEDQSTGKRKLQEEDPPAQLNNGDVEPAVYEEPGRGSQEKKAKLNENNDPVLDDELDAVGKLADIDSFEEEEDMYYSGTEEEEDDYVPGFSAQLDAKKPDDLRFQLVSTEEDILKYIDTCIEEANAVLPLPKPIIRILLNQFAWDWEKLVEEYYGGDQDKLFRDAGVVNPTAPGRIANLKKYSDCEICLIEYSSEDMYGLGCGHRFCSGCWRGYLTSKIMEDGMAHTIACAGHKCPILVDETLVKRVIDDAQVALKYEKLMLNSFIECNRLTRWCPSAGCTTAIRVNWVDSQPIPVTCTCRNVFCFQCGRDWHAPIHCDLLRKWVKKCADDSETSNWLVSNTKECPKCHVPIEKNGGCNHMTCRNISCMYHFCWVCLGDWVAHQNNYNCNKYDGEGIAAQDRSRAALHRYLFYSTRYNNHLQSLKFESKLYDSIKEKQEEMQRHGMSWADVQFLTGTVDTLIECRRVLGYTYAFAFYLQKNNQTELFEANQRDLESATELLSEYLERDIRSDNLKDAKQKVLDKYCYCSSRRQVLLDHVAEGYQDDTWEYNIHL